MMLQENYESVDKKITEACRRAGRNRDAVTLINMNIYPDRSNGI